MAVTLQLLLFNRTSFLESCWKKNPKNQEKMRLVSVIPGVQLLLKGRKWLVVEEISGIRYLSKDWKLYLYIVFLIHFH